MSHAELRKTAKSQHAAKLRSYGGHSDEAADRKMIAKAISQHESNDHAGKSKTKLHLASGGSVDGEMAAPRADRPQGKATGGAVQLAKGGSPGGKSGHGTKGTHVNIMIAPQSGSKGAGPGGPTMPPPGAGPGGPPMIPPHPPMPMPPPGAGPGGPPMMPPGAGGPPGRPFADGGRVENESALADADKDYARGPGALNRARGGGVKLEGSAAGGLGRLEKAAEAKAAGDIKENESMSDPDGEDKAVYDGKGLQR